MSDLKVCKDTFAVIIGIDKYLNKNSILSRSYSAIDDAHKMRELLIAALITPIKRERIEELTNASATREGIYNSIQQIREMVMELWQTEAHPDMSVFFFFAGHTAIDVDEAAYLCPYDTDLNSLKSTAISVEDLNKWLNSLMRVGLTRLFIFLDTCYAARFDISNEAHDGRVLIGASQAEEKSNAWKDEHNSVFTASLIRILKGDGTVPSKINITVGDIVSLLEVYMQQQRNDQSPYFSIPKGRDLPILLNPTYKDSNIAFPTSSESIHLSNSDRYKPNDQFVELAPSRRVPVTNFGLEKREVRIFLTMELEIEDEEGRQQSNDLTS